jgi:hypothetical protein
MDFPSDLKIDNSLIRHVKCTGCGHYDHYLCKNGERICYKLETVDWIICKCPRNMGNLEYLEYLYKITKFV